MDTSTLSIKSLNFGNAQIEYNRLESLIQSLTIERLKESQEESEEEKKARNRQRLIVARWGGRVKDRVRPAVAEANKKFEPEQLYPTSTLTVTVKPKFPAHLRQKILGRAESSSIEGDQVHYFDSLTVDEGFRAKGVATELMRRMCALWDRQGIDVFCDPIPLAKEAMSRENLITFYKKFGFVQTSTEVNYGFLIRKHKRNV